MSPLKIYECANLAPYAAADSASRGRVYPVSAHPFRSPYQRDVARIIHATAFRRLQHKTQVFVVHEGDHYRTRLTHTLEAAQITRTIARALQLNEDLAEAIALSHDLGHPPFGHSGEQTMNELMREHGGFGHNAHGLRIVEVLESRYRKHPGLNLSYEVREAFVRHPTQHFIRGVGAEFNLKEGVLLEAQITFLADEIAYDNHDLDDGLAAGILHEEALGELALWRQAQENVGAVYAELPAVLKRSETIRRLVDFLTTDLICTTAENIRAAGLTSLAAVREQRELCVVHSPAVQKNKAELQAYLQVNFYQHERVLLKTKRAQKILADLFSAYLQTPEKMPETFRARISTVGLPRVVCDYIAGMTDPFAEVEHARVCGDGQFEKD